MILDYIPPALTALALLCAGTLIGYWPTRKLIAVREARHDLKQGSAGFIRQISGWSVIAFWLGAVWFGGTIVGDWGATGDLDGAIERAWLRLQILLEILAALAESD
ncbi:MAG: hypothetical protein AAGM84_09300 [Pseudomonadota bacterium]